MDSKLKAERIYQRHLAQLEQVAKGKRKKPNNAAIGREFHCSREYVRSVIEEAHQNENGSDS